MPRVLAFVLAMTLAGAAPVPTPVGAGPKFRLAAASPPVARAAPVGRFRCLRGGMPREEAHVELFAHRRVLLLPPAIGMAPPVRIEHLDVRSARCSYAVRTRHPTGVIEFVAAARPTIGDLFRIWGQPLAADRLAGFRGPVRAWVGGRRWRGAVAAIPLTRHAQIVIELGGYVPPHASYRFPRRP
jgi:hypothetical protein